jgi:hypothetical protein
MYATPGAAITVGPAMALIEDPRLAAKDLCHYCIGMIYMVLRPIILLFLKPLVHAFVFTVTMSANGHVGERRRRRITYELATN